MQEEEELDHFYRSRKSLREKVGILCEITQETLNYDCLNARYISGW